MLDLNLCQNFKTRQLNSGVDDETFLNIIFRFYNLLVIKGDFYLIRIEGWEKRLDDFVTSSLNKRFVWGAHDCALFSCDAIKEITSIDVAYFFRGQYKSKFSAYEKLKEFGGGGLLETVEKLSKEFEMPEIDVSFAGRGDWVMANVPTVINEELPTLGIIGMSGKIYIAGTSQLQIFDKNIGVKFWKV
jgi:hypothetical protein